MTPLDPYLVDGMPVAVLIVLFSRIIFPLVDFDQSIQRLRIMLLIHWAMVAWWCIGIPVFLYERMAWFQEEYPTVYTLSLLANLSLLPLLLIKPLGRKLWFVMAASGVANIRNIYFLFDAYILQLKGDIIPIPEIVAAFSGLVVGLVLITLELAFRKKTRQPPNAMMKKSFILLCLFALALCAISYYYGLRMTNWYCCHNFNPPPFEYYYFGMILKRLAFFMAIFLIYSYIETLLKQWKSYKPAGHAA